MITIDDREVTEHPEIREIFTVPIKVERLDSADYAFLDRNFEPVGIERCEIGNLLQKIRNGELESQLTRCDEDYSHVMLLVEGVYDGIGGLIAHYHKGRDGNVYFRSRIEPNFRYREVKALLSRLSELGIELMDTPNFSSSVEVIETIYAQRTKPEEAHTLFKKLRPLRIPVKASSNPAVPKLLALCPRLPEKVAISLIFKYSSIWQVLNTPDDELLEMDGFGNTLLRRLKDGIGKP